MGGWMSRWMDGWVDGSVTRWMGKEVAEYELKWVR